MICTIDGKQYPFKRRTTVQGLLGSTSTHLRKIVAVEVNHRLESLRYRVKDSDSLTTLDLSHREGFRVYQNSLSFLLASVVEEQFPDSTLIIEHSFGDGLYCRFGEGRSVRKSDIKRIEEEMKKKIEHRIPFERIRGSKKTIIDRFIQGKKSDKAKLLEYRKRKGIDVYKFCNYIDLTLTPLVVDSSYLNQFALRHYPPGFILRSFPTDIGNTIPPFPDRKKLFSVFEEYEKWGEILEVEDIVSLNRKIEEGEISDLIKVAEALHEKKIAQISDEIKRKGKKLKIVLIAGPSASGKTTFSKRLAIQLRVNCLNPITLSIDNYYLERKKTPRLPDGSYDFESINAIDIQLLNTHLTALLNGREVTLPVFNFTTGKRMKGERIRMEKNQILILEGIHGLNERLTHQVPKRNKIKIYISALTQMNIDNEHRISTRDARILRRMVRDSLYRGHSATETFRLWKQVEKGEDKNIFPFQEEADVMFNSALIYELSVLKKFAEPLLKSVTPMHKDYSDSERLLKFLSFFLGISPHEVPPTSILREFIGKSSFLY
jgi:uridine kinase